MVPMRAGFLDKSHLTLKFKGLDRLDVAVFVTSLILLAAIFGVIASANRAGAKMLRIVYLGPVAEIAQNLFAVDPENPFMPKQVTDSQSGIVGYDVTPDGSKIV